MPQVSGFFRNVPGSRSLHMSAFSRTKHGVRVRVRLIFMKTVHFVNHIISKTTTFRFEFSLTS